MFFRKNEIPLFTVVGSNTWAQIFDKIWPLFPYNFAAFLFYPVDVFFFVITVFFFFWCKCGVFILIVIGHN